MTVKEILAELKSMAVDSNKKVLANHGAPVTLYGVKIGDMKKIQKKVKKNYDLSLGLYDSGIPDAQYLAGLIADETKMTKKDLQHWVDTATWDMISEYTVAWITAESDHGWELALKWIDNKKEYIQTCGWNTIASLVAISALVVLIRRIFIIRTTDFDENAFAAFGTLVTDTKNQIAVIIVQSKVI